MTAETKVLVRKTGRIQHPEIGTSKDGTKHWLKCRLWCPTGHKGEPGDTYSLTIWPPFNDPDKLAFCEQYLPIFTQLMEHKIEVDVEGEYKESVYQDKTFKELSVKSLSQIKVGIPLLGVLGAQVPVSSPAPVTPTVEMLTDAQKYLLAYLITLDETKPIVKAFLDTQKPNRAPGEVMSTYVTAQAVRDWLPTVWQQVATHQRQSAHPVVTDEYLAAREIHLEIIRDQRDTSPDTAAIITTMLQKRMTPILTKHQMRPLPTTFAFDTLLDLLSLTDLKAILEEIEANEKLARDLDGLLA